MAPHGLQRARPHHKHFLCLILSQNLAHFIASISILLLSIQSCYATVITFHALLSTVLRCHSLAALLFGYLR